ncbi:MAG: hypothetical protein E1N59_2838 [Puniceicoccaceae bacterium 5H]|nr:MAG: hypothetical protein E1N59_2838 [Puniceicoccaceae bacterium 5H]
MFVPILFLVLFLFAFAVFYVRNRDSIIACNVAPPNEIEYGAVTRVAEEALTLASCLVTQGTADNEVAICAANEVPLGVVDATAALGDFCTVRLLAGKPVGKRMIASEEIAADEPVYVAAAGKVQNEPAAAGTYYRIGRARTAATADGDEIIVETHAPVKVVVLAAFSGTAGTDIAAVGAALTEPAELKVLQA